MSAVAERAGVQRQTVYRHFADEEELLAACSAHYGARHPWPDADRWAAIADPGERLRVALDELYGWYEVTGDMWTRVLRDETLVAAVGPALAPFRAYLDEAARVLAAGWGARGARRATLLAATRHAVDFHTWRSLARDGGVSRVGGRRAHRGDGPPCGRPRRLIASRRPCRRRRGSRSSATCTRTPRRSRRSSSRRSAPAPGSSGRWATWWAAAPTRRTRSHGCASGARSPCWATTTTARPGAPSRSASAPRDRSPSARSSSRASGWARTRSRGCARAGRRPAAATSAAGTAARATRCTSTSARPTRRRAWRPSAGRSGWSRTRTSPLPGGRGSAARRRSRRASRSTSRAASGCSTPAPWGRPCRRGRGWWDALDAQAAEGASWLLLDLEARTATWHRAPFDPAPARARARALGLD